MKPAPAISTLATAGLDGSTAHQRLRQFARILARCLGEPHGEIAREIAVLRVAGALDLDARNRARRAAPGLRGNAAERLRQQFFDQGLQGGSEGCGVQRVGSLAPRAPRNPLNPLPADRRRSTSAGRADPGSSSTSGSQFVRKRCKVDARRRLDQEVRAKVIGAPRHQGARGPQHFDRRLRAADGRNRPRRARNASSPELSLASARSMASRE